MSTFTDTFNRGDGGLSNGWIVDYGSFSIASGEAGGTQGSRCYNQSINADGRQECTLISDFRDAGWTGIGPLVKYDPATGNGYVAYADGDLSAPGWHLRRITGGTLGTDQVVGGAALSAGPVTIHLLYDSGVLTLHVNGVLIQVLADSAYGANTSAGMYCWRNYGACHSFTLAGNEAVALSVSPSPIGNYGSATSITLTGVATGWTPGTPGSPIFTVDHGTLSSQVIASATSASAIYAPGSFLGIATFSDPSTGATCQVQVSSDPNVAPPEVTNPFDEDFIDLANASYQVSPTDQLTTREMVIIPGSGGGSNIDLQGALSDIWQATIWTNPPVSPNPITEMIWNIWNGVNGGDGPFTGPWANAKAEPLTQTLGFLSDQFYDSVEQVYVTTPQLLEAILNVTAPDLTDVRNDIGINGQQTYASLLSVLLSMWGEGNQSLGSIAAALGEIRGDDTTTLHAIYDAISGISAPDLEPVLDKLDLIQPSTSFTLSTIGGSAATAATSSTAASSLLTLIAGEGEITLAMISEAIQAVADLVEALSGANASLWPGVDFVTLGTEVALADGMTVTGTMNGIIVKVTGQPAHAHSYPFGSVESWSHVGQVIFMTDNGDFERAQSFGLDSQILTPHTMEDAAGCVIRLNAGWSGTVQPWARES